MPRLTRLPLLMVLFLPMPFGGCLSGPLRGANPSADRVTPPVLRAPDGKAVTRLADSAVSTARPPSAPNGQ